MIMLTSNRTGTEVTHGLTKSSNLSTLTGSKPYCVVLASSTAASGLELGCSEIFILLIGERWTFVSTFKVQLLLGLGIVITHAALIKTISNSLLFIWVCNNADGAILIWCQLACFKHVHEDSHLFVLSLILTLQVSHGVLHLVNLGHLRSNLMISLRLCCLLFLDRLLRSPSLRCHLQQVVWVTLDGCG